MFYGIPTAIAEGRFSQIFDNDVMKFLDKRNEDIDDAFRIYQKDSERNGSILDQTA